MNLYPFQDDQFPLLLKKALLSAMQLFGIFTHPPRDGDSNNQLLRKIILTLQESGGGGGVGPPGPAGPPGTNGTSGEDGWSPILAIVTDGARRVLQISSWAGGTGAPPASGDYIGAAGLTPNIALAVDIRGSAGPSPSGAANLVLATPDGAAGVASLRSLVDADIPAAIARDSEVSSAISALSTVYQPLDADLVAIAALTTTPFGRGLLELANAAALRTSAQLSTTDTPQFARLGLGTPADGSALLKLGVGTGILKRTTGIVGDAIAGTDYVSPGLLAGNGQTMNTGKILGRTTGGIGAVEEIDYFEGAFTPTLTFDVPGTLSVSYTLQTGYYLLRGRRIEFVMRMICNPTLGTASGNARIAGLPQPALDDDAGFQFPCMVVNNFAWPVGATMLQGTTVRNQTYWLIAAFGTSISGSLLTTTHFPNATSRTVVATGSYLIA
jgi:hypothetical protein